MAAALDLAAEHGAGALTPAAIARRAGLHKQAFYVHFKGLDECVAAATTRVLSEARSASELRHAELVRGPKRDRAAEHREMCLQLQFAREHAPVYRLLASARYAEGPMADSIREVIKQSRRLWTSTLLDVAFQLGITGAALEDIENLAGSMLEMSMITSMRLIDDPTLSIEVEATRHLRYSEHLVRRELRHMYRKQQEARVPAE